MRQPLEDRVITISRAKFTVEYPASFMLIASMNPCPCGYYNHPDRQCMCSPGVVHHAGITTILTGSACAVPELFKNTLIKSPAHCLTGLISILKWSLFRLINYLIKRQLNQVKW